MGDAEVKDQTPAPGLISKIVTYLHIAAPLACACRDSMLCAHDVSAVRNNGPITLTIHLLATNASETRREHEKPGKRSLDQTSMQGTEEEAAQDDAAAQDEDRQNDAASDAGSGQGQSFATFVAEAAHLQELVAAMGDDEGIVGRICTILDRYQEQPQLLDPHLESIITPLAATLRSACGLGGKDGESLAGVSKVRLACRVLYVLAKVRGFKVVIKFFPHSVTDLEPCLDLIVRQDALDAETWETRYVLLLWLSILVMVPFGLNTVDSATSGSNLIERIVDVCKNCLGEAAKTRDAAAYLLARLLTRPDMDDKASGEGGAKTAGSAPLVAFLQWCVVQMEGFGGQLLLTGVHQALANIFKMGQRNSLLDKVSMVSDVLHSQSATAGLSTIQRHNTCKLAQRLGLTYLPPRVAAWRYTRGHRSLLDNLRAANSSSSEHATVASTANSATDASRAKAQADTDRGGEDDEDDAFVPIEIEYVIDSLLQGLQDRDTVVRWSGAKGLGRVAARLPKHLANEVVEAVMALFTNEDASTVNTWHGGAAPTQKLFFYFFFSLFFIELVGWGGQLKSQPTKISATQKKQ